MPLLEEKQGQLPHFKFICCFGSYFLQTLYFYMWLNAVLFKQMLEAKTVKIVKSNIQLCYFIFC